MKKTILYLLLFAVSTVFITTQSCTKADEPYKSQEPTLPAEILDYSSLSGVTSDYKSSLKSSRVESISNAGATLGRVLFYDKKMSLNNSTACGTCHLQDKAFADGKELSNGFFNEKTLRNSPSIVNVINSEKFFWDARSEKLSDMVLNPVQDHIEMGLEDLNDLEEKLAATSYYPELFKDAFGSSEITKEKVGDALTQFLMSMASTRSKFDKGQADNFASFTAIESRGKQLFEDVGCENCHGGQDFKLGENPNSSTLKSTDQANVGLEMQYSDQGIGDGIFKIPSLRNVELTGPYMHDGRFGTLEQVVNHYSDHTVNHPSVDDRLKSDNPGSGSWSGGNGGFLTLTHLNLPQDDKDAIVAFLKTLTDNDLITDERFADPFNN
jgi:cytochrome c peroxidase